MKFFLDPDCCNEKTQVMKTTSLIPVFIPTINVFGAPSNLSDPEYKHIKETFYLVLYHYYNQWYDYVQEFFEKVEAETIQESNTVYCPDWTRQDPELCHEVMLAETKKIDGKEELYTKFNFNNFYWYPEPRPLTSQMIEGKLLIIPRMIHYRNNYANGSNFRSTVFNNRCNQITEVRNSSTVDFKVFKSWSPVNKKILFYQKTSTLNIVFSEYTRKFVGEREKTLAECIDFCKNAPADYVEIYKNKTFIHSRDLKLESLLKNNYDHKLDFEKSNGWQRVPPSKLASDNLLNSFRRNIYEAKKDTEFTMKLTKYKRNK